MRVLLTVAAVLVCLAATPALATDEPDPPPTPGGPVVTIPVDLDQITELVVTDVELEPTMGLLPGGIVRLNARIAAGSAPQRTVVMVDGVGEIEGDVPVAPDGTIVHEFALPGQLAPGRYGLSLSATGLGVASLGTVEVVAPAALATTTTEAAANAAPPSADVEQPVVGTNASTGRGMAVPIAIAGLLVGVALVALVRSITRRRRRAVASFEHTTALPRATVLMGQSPDHAESPLSDQALANPVPEPTLADDQFDLVELSAAADAGPETPPDERKVGVFADLATAKEAARSARSGRDVAGSKELWWEVRPAGKGPVWMIHLWALREYDLDSDSGEATPASR